MLARYRVGRSVDAADDEIRRRRQGNRYCFAEADVVVLIRLRLLAKSISRDETFDADIHDDLLLEGELTELVGRAAAELRSEGLTTRTITVRIRDNDFTTRQASRTVDEALTSDRALFPIARTLLHKLRKARRIPARLLGVSLSSFTAPGPRQLALFDVSTPPLETRKDVAVSLAMDAVRARFGRDAIAPGRKH